ncbi:calcium-binding protein [Rhodovulum viride]|nr:calcium-binding protein [Rhodovulum viride]
MSMISNNTSGAQMALSLLTAQAGSSGAQAAAWEATEQSDGATVDQSGETSRYDINAIFNAESSLRRSKLDAVAELSESRPGTAADQSRREATQREVIRLNARAEKMSIALQRLGSGPLSEGQRIIFLFSSGESNAVSIFTTGKAESIYLGGGGNVLSIQANTAESISTGGGHDAIAIKADSVYSVYTERGAGYEFSVRSDGSSYPRYVAASESNDAVAIQARRAASIYTGGGNDAIAIQAASIQNVYAGKGADAISLQGGVVSGIYAEDGNDVIAVDATIGMSVLHNLVNGSLMLGGIEYTRPENLEDRMRMATTSYSSDVLGGSGNDTISVSVQEVISIDGGTGDDVISIGGGTVGLRVGAGSGNDVVRVSQGAELVIQTDDTDFSFEKDGNDLIVRHSGGSVRIEDYENAAAIAVAGSGAGYNTTELLAQRERETADLRNFVETAEGTILTIPEDKINLDLGIEFESSDFQMIHIAITNPLDVRV